jgi:hypothetical protein
MRNARSLRFAISAVFLGLVMAGCGGGPKGPGPDEAKAYMKGLEGRGGALRPGPDANALYTEGMTLKAKGDCAGAAPKLRQVAGLGGGYESAQTALGECLLAGDTTDLSADYLEGLTWLRRAADAGWPEAQARLAYVHAVGPKTIRNADESAYWLALYRTNTGKARVGFMPFPPGQLAEIDLALPAMAKEAGEKRAETWQRKVWVPPPSAVKEGKAKEPPVKRRRGIPDDEP